MSCSLSWSLKGKAEITRDPADGTVRLGLGWTPTLCTHDVLGWTLGEEMGRQGDLKVQGSSTSSANFTNDFNTSLQTVSGNAMPTSRGGKAPWRNSTVLGTEEHVGFLAGGSQAFSSEAAWTAWAEEELRHGVKHSS